MLPKDDTSVRTAVPLPDPHALDLFMSAQAGAEVAVDISLGLHYTVGAPRVSLGGTKHAAWPGQERLQGQGVNDSREVGH